MNKSLIDELIQALKDIAQYPLASMPDQSGKQRVLLEDANYLRTLAKEALEKVVEKIDATES